jgi:hypothetical protein
VARKQIINKGASKTIPETAKMTSITLFESSPVGCGDPVAENRKLRTSTNPFMWVLLKTISKTSSLYPFSLTLFIKVMGGAQFSQACILSKLSLS